MQHSALDSIMMQAAAASSPFSGNPSSHLDVSSQDVQDFLAQHHATLQHQHQQQQQQLQQQYDHSTPNAAPSTNPTTQGGDFADLLAEFTSSNMLSPDSMAKSPPPTTTEHDMRDLFSNLANGASYDQQQGQGAPPPAPGAPGGIADAGSAHGGGAGGGNPLVQAIVNMDPSTQAQLLSALLTTQQQKQGRPPSLHQSGSGSTVSSPSFHQTQPSSQQGSPQAYPPAHQGSPQPYSSHYTSNQPAQGSSNQPPPAYPSAYKSLPTSHASSPLASPYLSGDVPHSQSGSNPPQPYPSSVPVSFQNAFSPRPFVPGQPSQQPPQQPPNMLDLQTQLAMGVFGRAQERQVYGDGQEQARNGGPDMRFRGASASGGSYATMPDSEWGENDFVFSPLMSPALTPQSVFTQASSLPPSVTTHGVGLVSPSDFFSPLGSPAMTPQQYDPTVTPSWSASHSHSNSLQGLVDQTKALGFSASNLQAMQAMQNAQQTGYFPQGANASPRLMPTTSGAPSPDAGQATATGSGRRGASTTSKKARPSPLLKPTPDGAVRRKKTINNGPTSEKRSSSMGSTGNRSATSSPFMGPTYGMTASTSKNGTGSGSSNKTSPPDTLDGSNGSNNSPSPVDLALNDQAMATEFELMGPPPPPSASKRHSLLGAADPSEWMNPVTPATFMNFPSDLSVDTYQALAANAQQQQAHSHDQQHSSSSPDSATKPRLEDSAESSTNPKGAKPKKALAKGPVPLMPAPAVASNGKEVAIASKPPLSASAGAATAVKIKAKSSAGTNGTSGGGPSGVRKIGPKPTGKGPGPSPKLKPLLPNGMPPDAAQRLSTKSNYQNLLDGRGVDLLGLDPGTVSALNATSGAGADNRRTSHKAAEQKRRDSLKQCFEELRGILPPLAQSFNDEDRRPGEGNVGGQRGGSIDPDNPNRGVSKVALLRRSNEYVGVLHDRIERRDYALQVLRNKLKELQEKHGEGLDEDVEELDLDHIDKDEKAAGTMAFYECLDSDNESDFQPRAQVKKAPRRKSNADLDIKPRPEGSRRSTRRRSSNAAEQDDYDAMDIEGE